jgi:protein ImuA
VANLLMPRVARATYPIPSLPPALQPWRADRLPAAQAHTLASGHPALDAQLPGGGWPTRALTELLLPHAGLGELRLVASALATLQQQQRCLMWFDPPAEPCAWGLAALGLDVRQLVIVRSRLLRVAPGPAVARRALPAADVLWSLEHALRSGHLGAALAWLPARLPADALRRLQLAAQAHDGPVFLLRDASERSRASPAALRLLLAAAGPDRLQVRLLKRRGPPLATALDLALPPVLAGPALRRAQQVQASMAAAAATSASTRSLELT